MTPERLTGMIVALGFVGVLLTSWLVASQIFVGPTCPDLLGIPACFMVLAAYVVATVAAWFPGSAKAGLLFYLGAGTAFIIAVSFSFCQARGTLSCPTFEGFPMCFTSLLGSSSMLALDVLRRYQSS